MRALIGLATAVAACGGHAGVTLDATPTGAPDAALDGVAADGRSLDAPSVDGQPPPQDAASAWHSIQIPTTNNLDAIWGTSDSSIWIGGWFQSSNSQTPATLLHFDGATWTNANVIGVGDIDGMWGTGPNDLWAWNFTWIGHYTGTWDWQFYGLSTKITAVGGNADGDVWRLQYNGSVDLRSGTTWTPVPSGTTSSLLSVWSADHDHAWFTGGGDTNDTRVWNGTTIAPATGLPLRSLEGPIWGTSAADVWIIDPEASVPGAYRWNGSAWSLVPTAGDEIKALDGRAPDDVWAIGWVGTSNRSDILHWDGTAWTLVTNLGAVNLQSLWVSPTGSVWVVGYDGVVFHN